MKKNWLNLLGVLSLWSLIAAIVWNAYVIKRHKQLTSTEIETIVHNYLLSNPRIMLEVDDRLRAQERAEEAAAIQRIKEAVGKEFSTMLQSPGELSGVVGTAKQDYVLWYFTQPRCPSCHKADRIVQEVVTRHPELEQRVYYWPFFGGEALKVAKLVMAAQQQGLASEFYQMVIGYDGALTEVNVQNLAGGLPGLDAGRLVQDVNQPSLNKILKDNFILASKLYLTGTPTIIITDRFGKKIEIISGFSETLKDDLEKRIDRIKQ